MSPRLVTDCSRRSVNDVIHTSSPGFLEQLRVLANANTRQSAIVRIHSLHRLSTFTNDYLTGTLLLRRPDLLEGRVPRFLDAVVERYQGGLLVFAPNFV